MKIEFTRAEVERVLLDYTNRMVGLSDPFNPAKGGLFNTVEGSSYRGLPDTIIVSAEEPTNAAQ
jgi:hypothetical protein